jgi:hypothetical protein
MRKNPYTQEGIKRMRCFRCDSPARFQWQICSDKNQYRPICDECDIALNELVLKFMGFANWRDLIDRYRKKMEKQDVQDTQ